MIGSIPGTTIGPIRSSNEGLGGAGCGAGVLISLFVLLIILYLSF